MPDGGAPDSADMAATHGGLTRRPSTSASRTRAPARLPWKAWGPYLSERQWGTVREDYSQDGDAWDYFSHDQARSRAYRWGEDGIAGICDDRQRLCLALALWNGADPILKERMFGLTNSEGNHGEDVKEYWFYLDSTPTHSYLKCQYKYPQRAFPYEDLVATNGRRGKQEMEYELLDTGIFDEDRYFDVVVEYAKGAPTTSSCCVTAHNRGPEAATLHLLPTLWFRNTWSWGDDGEKPAVTAVDGGAARAVAPRARRVAAARRPSAQLLFCENETNNERLSARRTTPYAKDAIGDFVVARRDGAVNPARTGTKVAAHHVLEIPAGASASIRVRLTAPRPNAGDPLGADFDASSRTAAQEADAFYATVIPPALDARRRDGHAPGARRPAVGQAVLRVRRPPLAARARRQPVGPERAAPAPSATSRGSTWSPATSSRCRTSGSTRGSRRGTSRSTARRSSLVDVDFAKEQVELLLSTRYLHPNGQIPAYEWNFSDVNPPVTAWAALFVYEREAEIRGEGDREFLARVFERLLTNFTWWVNRKDPDDRNLFQGGFLGLDNIGIFDRSAPLPGGGTLEQADGTAWMALYCQWMLQIAVELAKHDPVYADMALKFITHFEWIAIALDPPGGDTGLWDEEDGFYYDVMRMPDGTHDPAQGPLARRAAAAVRGDRVRRRRDRPQPRVRRARRRVRRRTSPTPCRRSRTCPARAPRAGACSRSSTSSGCAGSSRPCSTRRSSSARTASARSRAATSSSRACSTGAASATSVALPAGRVGHRDVRRQLQLARPGLVPDEPRDPARAAAAAPLLRRPARRSSARPARGAR